MTAKWLPTWWPVAVAVATILCNAGATYASLGGRLSEAERRLEAVERDRSEKLREYEQFRSDIRSDVAEIKTDLKWIRAAMGKGVR